MAHLDQGRSSADKEKLQGLWKPLKAEADGREAAEGELTGFQLCVQDNLMTFLPDNRTALFEVDAMKQPKTIDLIPQDGPAKGKKLDAGIYSLDDDELIICLNNGSQSRRPTEFKTHPGDCLRLLVLQRMKTL